MKKPRPFVRPRLPRANANTKAEREKRARRGKTSFPRHDDGARVKNVFRACTRADRAGRKRSAESFFKFPGRDRALRSDEARRFSKVKFGR